MEVNTSFDDEQDEKDQAHYARSREGEAIQVTVDNLSRDMPNGSEPKTEAYDPFDGAEGTNTALLITNMRILDVLYALYAEENDDKADALINAHAQGKVLGSLPQLTL